MERCFDRVPTRVLLLLNIEMGFSCYTSEEYADIVFVYGFCNGSTVKASAEYQRRYPNRRPPSSSVFSRVYSQLRESGTLVARIRSKTKRVRPRTDCSTQTEQIQIPVAQLSTACNVRNETITNVQSSPDSTLKKAKDQTSVAEKSANIITGRKTKRRGVLQFNIGSKNAIQGLHNLQEIHFIGPGDFPQRLEYCNWIIEKPELHRYILFTDEAQFSRLRIHNTRNSHMWAQENPPTASGYYQQQFTMNVWCGLLEDKLIGPFILDDQLTGETYLHFLQEKLPQMLEDIPLYKRKRIYFQHNGEPLYFTRDVMAYLDDNFPGRWISRDGPRNWPARSPDLSPLDCLWDCMKDIVYANSVRTRIELLGRIMDSAGEMMSSRRQMQEITSGTLTNAALCISANGGIFKNVNHMQEAMETAEDTGTRTGSNNNSNGSLQDMCGVYLPEHNMDVEEEEEEEDDDDEVEEEQPITIKDEPIAVDDVKSEPESFDDDKIEINQTQAPDFKFEDVVLEVKKECDVDTGSGS